MILLLVAVRANHCVEFASMKMARQMEMINAIK